MFLDQNLKMFQWSWHEMSRPQVHGYAMNCIAVLPNFSFVSGAEEKVARAFKAPKNTLENLSFLSNVQVEESFLEGTCCLKYEIWVQRFIIILLI